MGVCPAANNIKFNTLNSGKNGGRCCWIIAGTLCGDNVQGVFAQKVVNCMSCDFYKMVLSEETAIGKYISPSELLRRK